MKIVSWAGISYSSNTSFTCADCNKTIGNGVSYYLRAEDKQEISKICEDCYKDWFNRERNEIMGRCINYDAYEENESLQKIEEYTKELLKISRLNLAEKEEEYEKIVRQAGADQELLVTRRCISHFEGRISALNMVLAKLKTL